MEDAKLYESCFQSGEDSHVHSWLHIKEEELSSKIGLHTMTEERYPFQLEKLDVVTEVHFKT